MSLSINDDQGFDTKARNATDRLLARLREQHDYTVPSAVTPQIVPIAVKTPSGDDVREAAERWLQKALKRFPPENDSLPCKVKAIQRAVVASFPDITMNDINSARRTRNVVHPRQIAMYLVKEMTLRSLPDIGRRFGGRDHTTVIHAVRKIAALIKTDPILAAQVERIKGHVAEASA